jgi:hypothetical protein
LKINVVCLDVSFSVPIRHFEIFFFLKRYK